MKASAQPRPTGHPGYSETLPCREESAEVARRLVRTALAAWHLEELTETGTLLVSELVANSVKHTNSRLIRVVIARPSDRFVRIGVVDKSRTMPEIKKSNGDDLSLGGRGLILMDAMTNRWGTDLYRWGKQVWGELRCEGATVKNSKAWVGDKVHDEDAGRTGMVTDVSGGTYVLRPLTGGGNEWTQDDPDRLTVIVPQDYGWPTER